MAKPPSIAVEVPKYLQIPNQAAGILLVGKDYDKIVLRKIFDPISKRLTDEALEACGLTGIHP